jgi:hypothetical protein
MSISKIHIARFNGAVAKEISNILECNRTRIKLIDFCNKFVGNLNSGMSNDYTMIWDNYSVGGDQIDYTYRVLSKTSVCHGLICSPSWKVAFGYDFKSSFQDELNNEPIERMHRIIYLSAFKSMPLDNKDLIVCIEQVLGPTVHDEELDEIQKSFIQELERV